MSGDSSSCLIGLLNHERDCSLVNWTYKVQYPFFKCRAYKKAFPLVCVVTLLYIYRVPLTYICAFFLRAF